MFTFKKNFVSNCRITSPVRPCSRLRLETPPLALQSPAKRIRYESPQLTLLDSPQKQKLGDDQQLSMINCQSSIVSTVEPTKRQLLNLLHSPLHVAKVVKVDTPPTTPEAPVPSKEAIRDELQAELHKLIQEVEAKFQETKDHLDHRTKNGHKRLILDDYMAMANKAQRDVRALCNEIYNPGVELANSCSALLEEAKKNHASKFEKLTYEMTERMDATEITIRRKKDQLKHEIELYERTLVALKEEQDKRDQDAKEATEQLVEEVSAVEEPAKEDSARADSGKEESVKGDFSQGEASDTEECIIVDKSGDNDDADKTDIEEIADDEVAERPFTPCQAQRPV